MMDASGALGETIVFLDHFRSLPDPRQRGKVIYPLAEVLLLGLGQFPRQVGRVRQVDSGAFRTAGDMIRC